MKEWKEYRLGDVISIAGGFAYKGEFIGSGCNYLLSMGCVSFSENFLDKGARQYAGECPDRFYAYPGDIVLATRQQSDNLPILGMPAIIPSKYEGHKMIVGANLYRVDIKDKSFNNRFLYWLLKTPSYVSHIRSCQSGTTVRMITKSNIEDYIFYAPDKKTRDCISDFIWALDDKIEVNRKINENLEQQAQALFKSWFVDFEPFKDGEFVESELGMIPKGWRVGYLDELCSFISRGLTPKYDETSEELILGQTCVRNNIVTLNNARKHRPKTKNEKWVQQWDVLLNSTGVGSLGRVGIVYFNMDNVAIDSHITVVRVSNPIYRHYVGRNLLSRQLEIENMAVGSTGQTELPRDRVKVMTIIIPSQDSMIKFNNIIEPMAISMYNNIIESRRLAELRDTLLPKLMSGEIKV